MGFYKYVKRIGNIGVGVENLGFVMPQSLPLYDGWMRPRYEVRHAMDVHAPGFVKYDQQFQAVSIVGNGIQLSGQFELQRLAQMEAGK